MSKLLIFYDHFFPAQKAGGIVQSIHNIVCLLGNTLDIFIVSSCYEFETGAELAGIETNSWLNYENKATVIYLTKEKQKVERYKEIIKEIEPQKVYLNGIFSLQFFIKPLIALRSSPNLSVTIAPRGMLQQGALAIKPVKKKMFFVAFKLCFPFNKYEWHATDETEMSDIQKFIGSAQHRIKLAGVLPKLNEVEVPLNKYLEVDREFRLIYVSLITKKKNLLILLQSLLTLPNTTKCVSLSIYGPIKDQAYWQACEKCIKEMPSQIKVNYYGALLTDEVEHKIQHHHLFVLPTAGENFGHAIFEALANATPVLISPLTPFLEVEYQNAGFVVLPQVEALVECIKKCLTIPEEEWLKMAHNSRKFALDFFYKQDYISAYNQLFGEN